MEKIRIVLKSVLASYIVTGVILLLLTFVVYQFEVEEDLVTTGITATYLLSTFLGGFIAGRIIGRRKFLWGLFVGFLYIGILYMLSHFLYGGFAAENIKDLMPGILCILGGMAGGMIA